MTELQPQRRWYRLTPDRLVLLLLVVECLLWMSNRLGWPAWQKSYTLCVSMASPGIALILMLVWSVGALIFRWRFQFSIRSLLVLVVVVAVPFSLAASETKEEQDALTSLGKYYGGATERTSILPVAVRRLLRLEGCGKIDRVKSVYLSNQFYGEPGKDHTEEVIDALKKLHYLKLIVVSGPSRLEGQPLDDEKIEKAIPNVLIISMSQ